MSGILTAIRAADEAYLVALANKGIYKRACRELPEAGITVAIQGDTVTATFGDGTVVTLEGSIQTYRCSCPSRSVCKHLLMAVLAAQLETLAQAGEAAYSLPEDAPALPDYSYVTSITARELEKMAGKRLFRQGVLAVQLGEQCRIEEGSTLGITLADTGHRVLFLPGSSVADAGCSCKSPDICAHRTQAILQYIQHKKGSLPDSFLPQEEEVSPEYGADTLPYLGQFIAQVMDTGLARLPEDASGRFLQLATICHSQRLANPERLCSRIAGQLEHYQKGSATFQRDWLISDLCQLISLCEAIEQGDGSRETVGVFRETYRPVAQMELWGLGAYGWHSTGGYTGVTTLWFEPAEKQVLTYTTALPDTTNPKMEALFEGGAPWGMGTKLSAIVHARLSLKGGKISDKGQLSSSDSGKAQSLGGVDIHHPALTPLRFDDFDQLLEALWQREEAGLEGPLTAILLPQRTGNADYDSIRQQWSCPLYDKAERKLLLSVRFEAHTRRLLDNLAEREQKGKLWQPMLARVSLSEGRPVAYPVTLYGEQPCDLGLYEEKTRGRKKGPLFDWGDPI